MPRAALAPVAVGAAGVALSDVTVAAELVDGNAFPWSRTRRLYVANGDDVALTVTVQTPVTVGARGLAVADEEFTVSAGETLLLPRLGPEFRRPTDGAVWVDYDGPDAAVTVAVLDL